MLNKLTASCKRLSPISLKLMFYGTKLALGVLLIGFFAYKYNEYLLGGEYFNSVLCIQIVQASFSLFVQFIIGGLIFDCATAEKR